MYPDQFNFCCRYFAIMYPLSSTKLTKSRSIITLSLIWIFGIALSLVHAGHTASNPFPWGNETYHDCKETWEPEIGRIYTGAIFTITFALPMCILIFAYVSIGWKMYKHSIPGNADVARDEAQFIAKM